MYEIKKHIKNRTKIYSLEHGAGEIIGILKFYDGIQDYIEVKFFKNDDEVILYPSNFQSDLRVISNPIELTAILKSLSLKISDTEFEQAMIYRQRIGADVDLDYLTNTIATIVGNISQKKDEKQLLANCIKSLILEVSHVYKMNEKRARGIVSDYMRAA